MYKIEELLLSGKKQEQEQTDQREIRAATHFLLATSSGVTWHAADGSAAFLPPTLRPPPPSTPHQHLVVREHPPDLIISSISTPLVPPLPPSPPTPRPPFPLPPHRPPPHDDGDDGDGGNTLKSPSRRNLPPLASGRTDSGPALPQPADRTTQQARRGVGWWVSGGVGGSGCWGGSAHWTPCGRVAPGCFGRCPPSLPPSGTAAWSWGGRVGGAGGPRTQRTQGEQSLAPQPAVNIDLNSYTANS